ncbi:uncharacterized protein METZ01_LOCUS269081 [marine metagenome]|uniref:PqqD family protein n=1 Tax=marine metagenome TaxID=408172 RepID=A0A382JZD5_9ZZZZ
MLATRKKPRLTREAMLNSRPARNELLTWETNETGEAQITVARSESWKTRILSKVFYIPLERTITLDSVGTDVWNMCDGDTSVSAMIQGLQDRYKLDRKEAEVSLLSYLKTLGQKNFVGFLIDDPRKANDSCEASDRSSSGSSKGKASGKKW